MNNPLFELENQFPLSALSGQSWGQIFNRIGFDAARCYGQFAPTYRQE
ncbi:MAG: hypothetical protein KDD43_15765 [Bdellovibrionales bacterium]|nr:hypothetical protein [Bdellovibrionales bacterium]